MRAHNFPSFRVWWFLLATAAVLGCQIPTTASSGQPGTVRISVQSGSRAVVADWSSVISSYSITLHCTDRTLTDLTQSATPATIASGVTFSAVNVGTWLVSVTARNATAQPVAAGSQTATLTTGASPSVSISLSGTQTGSGAYSLTVQFPQASASAVTGQLYTMANVAVGSSIAPTLATPDSGTSWRGTLAQSVASGNYRLQLTFTRSSGTVVGVYSEGVTVWDNVTSDQYVDSTGSLSATRTFNPSDFNSSDASLSALTATAGGTALSFGFSSTVTSYSVMAGSAVTFTPVESLAGQRIQYKVGSGSWSDVISGNFTTAVALGSTICFQVTATDQQTTKTYTLAVGAATPTNLVVVPTSGTATLTWTAATGATSYNLYYSSSSSVTTTTGTQVTGVTSGYAVTGLTNWTTYYFIVTSVVAGVESAATAAVSAMPPNLLLNSAWTQGTSTPNWTIVSGGSGWTVAAGDSSGYLPGYRAMVSSSDWDTLSQTVNLIADGFTAAQLQSTATEVNFGVYFAGDYMAASYGFVNLELLDASGNVLATSSNGTETSPLTIGTGASWSYQGLTWANTSGLAVAQARVTCGGKDSLGWAGDYGSWLSVPTLTVSVPAP